MITKVFKIWKNKYNIQIKNKNIMNNYKIYKSYICKNKRLRRIKNIRNN